MYERILVPLDGSQLAEDVLPYVKALAEKFGSTVTLLRVVPPIEAYMMASMETPIIGQAVTPYPTIDTAGIEQAEKEAATEYLQKLTANWSTGKPDAKQVVTEGPAAEMILEAARNPGADLIAMTTHGRGGLARLVMGSVADEVIRKAACPVLLVRVSKNEASPPPQGEG